MILKLGKNAFGPTLPIDYLLRKVDVSDFEDTLVNVIVERTLGYAEFRRMRDTYVVERLPFYNQRFNQISNPSEFGRSLANAGMRILYSPMMCGVSFMS